MVLEVDLGIIFEFLFSFLISSFLLFREEGMNGG
jgi:hypothetical protein